MVQTVWVPVIVAVVTAVLTAAGILGRDWINRRHEKNQRRLAAYARVYSTSYRASQAALSMRVAMQSHSGLSEVIGLRMELLPRRLERTRFTLYPRSPLITAFDVQDRIRRDFDPLLDALGDVQALGTAAAIRIANDILDAVIKCLEVSTERGTARSPLLRYLYGDRFTKDQEETLQQAADAIGKSRIRLMALLREEGGEKAVDLVAGLD